MLDIWRYLIYNKSNSITNRGAKMTGQPGKSGGARPGAGRPTLGEQFTRQKEAVEMADGFGQAGEFEVELAKMRKLQKRIAARLAAAQAIVDELEPLVNGGDWRQMEHWVKKYGN